MREYVAKHRAGGSVETVDLARAVERVTGRNVDRFFDEYVHRAGHPQLKVEVRYETAKKQVRVSVKQAQEGEPVRAHAAGAGGGGRQAQQRTRSSVSQKEHVFFLPAAREPSQVVVDARRDLLGTVEVEKPMGLWRAELLHAEVARARTEAAAALAKDPAAASVAALEKVLKQESVFWGTRAACAKAPGHAAHSGGEEGAARRRSR